MACSSEGKGGKEQRTNLAARSINNCHKYFVRHLIRNNRKTVSKKPLSLQNPDQLNP
jgi:hypothetical protein